MGQKIKEFSRKDRKSKDTIIRNLSENAIQTTQEDETNAAYIYKKQIGIGEVAYNK